MSRTPLVSIPASSAATRLIHWAQLGHFASSVDPKKGAARLFQTKLPNKSTGGCFAAAALTKLCPIKPDRIYAVPCYSPLPCIVPRRPWSFSFYRYPSRFRFPSATGSHHRVPLSEWRRSLRGFLATGRAYVTTRRTSGGRRSGGSPPAPFS